VTGTATYWQADESWCLDTARTASSHPHGFSYCKHSVGYRVSGPEWQVDFDFGDGGRMDGQSAPAEVVGMLSLSLG